MKATVSIVLHKDSGVTVSREVAISTSPYGPRESQAKFKARVHRQARAALNSVLGTPDDLEVTRAAG